MAGLLALVGGNEFRKDCVPMDRALLEVLGQEGRVAILPTAAANENPGKAGENGVRHFRALGARAEAVMITGKRTANDPAFTGPLADFNLIYLTGGSPPHLLESLRASAALKTMRAVLARGGMVAGSSAGAMAMGARCWGFEEGWLEGWGLAPGVTVIPHHASFAARRGTEDMRRGLARDVTLLGIDEATAAYGDGGGTWRVVGAGQVTVYAADTVTAYGDGQTFSLPEQPSTAVAP